METQAITDRAALPSLRAPITLRGIPADLVTRALAEPVAVVEAVQAPEAFVLQHVAAGPSGAPGACTPYKMTAEQVRRAIRTYTGSFAHAGERLHVRDARGNLIAAYRAEAGRWITVAAFAASQRSD